MKKELTPQIAAMYLGCEVYSPEGMGVLFATNTDGVATVTFGAMGPDFDKAFWLHEIKILLRPLSDVTADEAKEIWAIAEVAADAPLRGIFDKGSGEVEGSAFLVGYPPVWLYLLSKHFDLFGLIEAGVAIYKTKIVNHGTF